jgi:hypothetical protein
MSDTESISVPHLTRSRLAQSAVLKADDPKCDLVLEVTGQDGALDLYVSSQTLSLASSVFDKMLSSKFREGLEHNETSDRKRISLPQDDGQALMIICVVVHHRSGGLEEVFSPDDILKMAYVSDKYNFTDALRHRSTVWLSKSSHESSVEDLESLLTAASLFDAWEEYSRISFDYVCQQTGPFTRSPASMRWSFPKIAKGRRPQNDTFY